MNVGAGVLDSPWQFGLYPHPFGGSKQPPYGDVVKIGCHPD